MHKITLLIMENHGNHGIVFLFCGNPDIASPMSIYPILYKDMAPDGSICDTLTHFLFKSFIMEPCYKCINNGTNGKICSIPLKF